MFFFCFSGGHGFLNSCKTKEKEEAAAKANEVSAQYSSDCSWHDCVEHNNTTNKAIYLK